MTSRRASSKPSSCSRGHPATRLLVSDRRLWRYPSSHRAATSCARKTSPCSWRSLRASPTSAIARLLASNSKRSLSLSATNAGSLRRRTPSGGRRRDGSRVSVTRTPQSPGNGAAGVGAEAAHHHVRWEPKVFAAGSRRTWCSAASETRRWGSAGGLTAGGSRQPHAGWLASAPWVGACERGTGPMLAHAPAPRRRTFQAIPASVFSASATI